MTAEELMATIAALSSIGLILFTFYVINSYIFKPKKTMLVNTHSEKKFINELKKKYIYYDLKYKYNLVIIENKSIKKDKIQII
jgi:hypothetical protein